jgi:hypothetical protein|tara:strand:+ start:515 stop:1987 length:1473 start_codon:yes stop_codon:yes gene_type:complete
LIVLDIDSEEGRVEALRRGLPSTPTVLTGKGMHVFFKHHGEPIRNFARKLPGIDLRADGGYVVAAPSKHISGKVYEWQTVPWKVEMAGSPEWLLGLTKAIDKAPAPAVDGKINDGERSVTLASLAGSMRRRGMTQEEITTAMLLVNKNRCNPPLPDDVVIALSGSISNYDPAECTKEKIESNIEINSPKTQSALEILDKRDQKIATGEYRCIDFADHDTINAATSALLPASITIISGSPGQGKSLFILQCVREWQKKNEKVQMLVFEKDEEFYLNRWLAQETGVPGYTNDKWTRSNMNTKRAAKIQYRERIEKFYSDFRIGKPGSSFNDVAEWVEQMAKGGARVIIIDPITALCPEPNTWISDHGFVMRMIGLTAKYEFSLIIVTHPAKGMAATLDTLAGGAAYPRFSSCVLAIKKFTEDQTALIETSGGTIDTEYNAVVSIEKSTMSWGQDREVAFRFGRDGLIFTEIGLITSKRKKPKDTQESRKDLM